MNMVRQEAKLPEPHPTSESATVLNLISKVASDPNADIEKMERLLAMHERMSLKQAEQEFNEALALVQAGIGRIKPNKRNSQTSSAYADYAQLDRIVRPVYSEHGFALSFGTEPCEGEYVNVICHCSHRGGYTRKYSIEIPADGKGAKGNDVMTKTHATGSAMSYGQRYLLRAIFNLAISADDDGNAASSKPATTAYTGQPTSGAWEAMDSAQQIELTKIALAARDFIEAGEPAKALAHIGAQKLGYDQTVATPTQPCSKGRPAPKKAKAHA